MRISKVEELFLIGLQYIYDGEQQLTEALPRLAQTSSTPQLREVFTQHLDETKQHLARDLEIFKRLGLQAQRQPNAVIKQMLQEAEQMIVNTDESPIRDAALIVVGNQVEHYEIASYGSLRNFAQLIRYDDIVALLEKTLLEEKNANGKLTEVGESAVNVQAIHRSAAASA